MSSHERLPYPNTIIEFARMFATEEACANYLLRLRWPDGQPCASKCEGGFYFRRDFRVVHCRGCRKDISLTAGTIMHRSKQPVQLWFYGAFLVTTLTPGISALQFQKQMGLTNYETAFQMLHKLRAATVNPDRDPLHGAVEVDKTYVGGSKPGAKGGRSTEHKSLVIGAVEVEASKLAPGGRRAKRVRLRVIPAASGAELTKFVRDHVVPGAVVYTDGWEGCSGLRKLGYDHKPTVEGAPERVGKTLPVIHREFANLKTWLQGTHHGRVERQHLQAYLNEFAFRHNRRFWKFSAFQRVLQIGVKTKAPTYRDIYETDEYGRCVHAAGVKS